jgi:ribonucleoside-diphosphate reductase beta chain
MSDIRGITAARRIAFGPQDRLMSMAHVKYKFAIDVYETMEANTWFTKSIPMGTDRDCYRSQLTEQERSAYDKALAFVSNLDGIQFNNLITNIGTCITAPEVSLAIARQAAEEGVHVRAYQTMIEAVSLDPAEVYMMFERDGLLARKNAYIMEQSDILRDEQDAYAFARAVVGNLLLEGVFFYAAFLVFYVLARNGKMLGSADMIKYINRDEGGTHLELFAGIHNTFRAENPQLYDRNFYADARRLFMEAVELEIEWGQYIIGKGIQGLTPAMVEGFVKHLANLRWTLVGAPGTPVLYPGVTNPVPWFDEFSNPNGTRANFFERKPTDYAVDGLDW